MADEGDVLTNLDAQPAGNGADTQPIAGVISQYVKDLSVENPKAPESFQWRDQQEMDVQFNIAARKVNDDLTEVELKITATSKTSQGSAYIVDLVWLACATWVKNSSTLSPMPKPRASFSHSLAALFPMLCAMPVLLR